MTKAVRYRIDWSKVSSDHTFYVEATYPVSQLDTLELFLPVWTPGSYLIREYSRQLECIEVLGHEPEGVSLVKVRKNAWKLSWKDDRDEIQIRYRLYAREKSVRTNWVEPDYGFIVGAATFLSSHRFAGFEHKVTLADVPSTLSTDCILAMCGQSECGVTYLARNFDELVDSPILVGALDRQSFDIDGRPHQLVSIGETRKWDLATAAKDTHTIVQTVQRFWEEVPYESYRFQNLVLGGYGGLEHDNCCVLMAEPNIMVDRNAYVDWLGLVCHEFFHTWNVRRLRPKVLMQYDYENEQYLGELWISEGVTSYFDDLLVYRAGLCSETEYLQRLSKAIQTVMNAPGRNVQSLQASSFDTWIKLYRPDENSHNSRISYYTKGAIVAWLLDIELAKQTQFRVRLDDVMRQLWVRFRSKGFELSDFERLVTEMAGGDWLDWFDRHVRSVEELCFDEALSFLGLRWKCVALQETRTLQSIATALPSGSTEPVSRSAASLGCETKDQNGRAVITKVQRGGCSAVAGLQVDDELVSIDGFRLTNANINSHLQHYDIGQNASITFFRRDVLRTVQIQLDGPQREWKLEVIPDCGNASTENRSRWLRGDRS